MLGYLIMEYFTNKDKSIVMDIQVNVSVSYENLSKKVVYLGNPKLIMRAIRFSCISVYFSFVMEIRKLSNLGTEMQFYISVLSVLHKNCVIPF